MNLYCLGNPQKLTRAPLKNYLIEFFFLVTRYGFLWKTTKFMRSLSPDYCLFRQLQILEKLLPVGQFHRQHLNKKAVDE